MKAALLIIALLGGILLGILGGTYLASRFASRFATCEITYTAQRGDTLAAIAARAGTAEEELARLNNLQPSATIRAGQLLCLPAAAGATTPSSPEATPTSSPEARPQINFELTAEYQLDPAATNAGAWRVGSQGTLGRRLQFPILPDGVKPYSNTTEVQQISAAASPLLWLAPVADSEDYILVAIGNPDPLLDLRRWPTQTRTISEIVPPDAGPLDTSALLEPETLSVQVQAQIVGADGSVAPFSIVLIDYLPTVDDAASRYPEVAFALHPSTDPATPGYELLVDPESSPVGPPGPGSLCDRWSTGGGAWSDYWRAIACGG
jgi:murein DD-endopeptidase MepM/ murein hydrolase activator NlpD